MLTAIRSRLVVLLASVVATALAALGVVPAAASAPTARTARPRTQAISATLQGTSTIDQIPDGGLQIATDVSSGAIVGRNRDTARLVSYRFDGVAGESATGFSYGASVTLRRPKGATVNGFLLVPTWGGTLDGTITVEGGTKAFRNATGTLAVTLARGPGLQPPFPIHTTDAGTISGTLVY
jgi:hypothetical protein